MVNHYTIPLSDAQKFVKTHIVNNNFDVNWMGGGGDEDLTVELTIPDSPRPIRVERVSPIKKVIVNDPVTVVIWADGTKTVVKCNEGELFDQEKGLAMAFAKKLFGNKGNYYNHFKEWLPW